MTTVPFDQLDGVIWMNGQMGNWPDAKLHVLSHGLHYGSSVFEGERMYGGEFFQGANHIEPGGLGFDRRGSGIGAAIFSQGEPNAFQARGGVEIRTPVPCGNVDIDSVVLSGNAHLLATPPGNGTNISLGQPALGKTSRQAWSISSTV